jgi:TonB family protein
MDKLIIALVEVSVALIVFYVYYLVFLKKLAFFSANRWFLLGTAMVSLVLPWIQFNLSSGPGQQVIFYNVMDAITVTAQSYEQSFASMLLSLSVFQWIVVVYLAGLAFRLIIFIYQIVQIFLLQKNSFRPERTGQQLVYVSKNIAPFSFLNRIYLNPAMYSDEQLNEIVAHESIHVGQRHTIDCLFYELLIILFWFHPVVYRYRNEAKEVHEFLADQGAIRSGIDHIAYQQLLFAQTMAVTTLRLPNSFNYSLLKRRMIMLTQKSSSKLMKTRFVWLAPVALAVIIVFACNKADNTGQKVVEKTVNNESTKLSEIPSNDSVYTIVEKMPEYPGGQGEFIKYIGNSVKFPEIAKEHGIQGKVYVQFVINQNGQIEDVKVIRGVDPALDAEAVRVIKNMPTWIPGENKGEKVKVQFVVPINFVLN